MTSLPINQPPKPPLPISTGGTLPSIPQPGVTPAPLPKPDPMRTNLGSPPTTTGTGTGTTTGTGTEVDLTDGGRTKKPKIVDPLDPYKRKEKDPPPTTAAPTTGAFDPNSFAESMKAFTASLVQGLKPQPIKIEMPKAWSPTKDQLAGISAESRIPGLLNGATAKQAAQLALGQANARGLLNSSMAVQGANNAMIANAADIASGDATRYGGLLQTQVNNEGALQRLGVQGQINERQSALDQGYKLDSMGVNMMGDAMKFDAQNKREDFEYGRGRADALADRTDARGYEQTLYDRGRAADLADRDYNNARIDSQRAEATETALRTAYVTEVDSIKDALNREVAAIQQSDLPPDVKDAQVQEAVNRAKVNVRLTNTMFQSMPQWKEEWAQLTLD